MPADVKLTLEAQGAIFWEKFAKDPTNRFDTRGISSQELGYIETSLTVEPPQGGRKLTKDSIFDGIVSIEEAADMFEPLTMTPAEMKREFSSA